MKTEKLEFRGGNYMSLLPFTVFIITTIALSFANFQDISMMVGAGVVGLLVCQRRLQSESGAFRRRTEQSAHDLREAAARHERRQSHLRE